jgi:hypothetical protein
MWMWKFEDTDELRTRAEAAEAEIRRLRAKLTLAEYALGTIVHMGDGCEVECCHIKSPYTLADDALTQMSVVE